MGEYKETTHLTRIAPEDIGFNCLGLIIRFNYVIFYWLGIGTLLPWNMFITVIFWCNFPQKYFNVKLAHLIVQVVAYWSYKFRTIGDTIDDESEPLGCSMNMTANTTTPHMNQLQSAWSGYLAVASMLPNVTFLLLNAAFGHLFKTQPRLIISLILVILSFIFTTIMVYVDTDGWQNAFLAITLASVVFINVNAAIFQVEITTHL